MRFSITSLLLAATATLAAAKINHRPDNFWDHVVKGADVQRAAGAGSHEKRLDGELAQYQLRVRKNDPSKLGIDSVKQYSGYLDDEANDKHLFYCQLLMPRFLRLN